ncbi:MAG: hypothetical protein ACKOTF_09390, partial [Opitutaceae bacterium]
STAGISAGSADEALQHLRSGPFRTTNLGFAQVDHHRRLRQGLGEVIFGEGKTAAQVLQGLVGRSRADADIVEKLPEFRFTHEVFGRLVPPPVR